jgi:hypothetical protein
MLVWGGSASAGSFLNSGGRYDPTTDSWTLTSTDRAPTPRRGHTAVWTGGLMLVWGGSDSDFYLKSGGRYDPTTDSWASTSTVDAPSVRDAHTAVWTGSHMLVWGGWNGSMTFDTGGRYDPEADSWTLTSSTGAPESRNSHTAVWTGSHMLVWGGFKAPFSHLNTGGRYDPATDSWEPTSTAGAPLRRCCHTAVWTGSFMLVWGGNDFNYYWDSGGRYALGHSVDDDGDGYSECDGDCNDQDWATYPDAPERNDGQDNQCPGDTGYGLIDEISGLAGFFNPGDTTEYSWPAQPGATLYGAARSGVSDFSHDCTTITTDVPLIIDPAVPPSGSVFFYLVRSLLPFAGSWGMDSAGSERDFVCENGP